MDKPKTQPAYADIIYDVMSFAGGMNSRASQLYLGKEGRFSLRKDQAPLLVNLVRTSTGALQSRLGRVAINETPVSPPAGNGVIRSLFELRTQSGSNYILMNAGNTVYLLSGSTWVSQGTVASNNLRMHWAQFNDVALGINGTDTPIYFDGTVMGNVGGSPPSNGAAIATHRNRVWIVAGRSLKYCALGNYNDWTTSNNAGSIPIPTTRGGGGTALISLWDRLIVFTSDQVFQVIGTGPATFSLEPINLLHGHQLAAEGVLAAGNDIYYGSQAGCHSLSMDYTQSITGDVTYNYASGIIEPTWQDIATTNLGNVVGVHDSQRNLLIFLCNRSGSENTEALVLDYYHLNEEGKPTWSIYGNMPFASAAEVYSINNSKDLLFGGYDGVVYRQSTLGTDNGANLDIQLQYVTDLDTVALTKLWRYMVLFATAAEDEMLSGVLTFDFGDQAKEFTMTLTARPSGGILGSTFTIGSSVLGSGALDYRMKRVGIAGHGRLATVTISGSVGSRVTIGGMIFYAGIRRAIIH